MLTAYDVRAPGPDTEAHQLSGGNQQKLVLARALEARPSTLLVENPTRGLDLAATAAVHDRLRRAREEGIAVVVYSSDLDEILELGCDRLLVVCRGRVGELPPQTPRGVVGEAMLRGTGPG
jgi:simple sugar transport system ATP-binding protein